MRKNIVFGSLLSIAIVWIIYALFIFHYNSSNVLKPEVFFSNTDTITVVNKPIEFNQKVENSSVSFNKTKLDSLLDFMIANPYWTKLYYTKSSDSTINKLILEGNQTIDYKKLKVVFQLFQLDTTQISMSNQFTSSGITVLCSHQFIAFSITPFELYEKSNDNMNFNNCDDQASYNVVSKLERKDVYQNGKESKTYITQTINNAYIPVEDINFYSVMPSQTSSFLFIEKNLLLSTFPKWQGNPLLQAVDFGVMETKFEGKKVVYFEINGDYTPDELKDLYSNEDIDKNASIFPIKHPIPSMQNPYATCIENILVLCGDRQTLENVRINYQIGKLFNTSSFYTDLVKSKPKKVSVRWWGNYDLSPFGLNSSKEGALIYQKNSNQRIIALEQSDENKKIEIDNPSGNRLLWTTSVGNASTITTTNGVIAVWDKASNTITLVNVDGKLLRKINLSRSFLTLNALTNGFTLIGKTNMLWIPTNADEKTVEYDFKEQLQNIAADYSWRGRQQLGFLTETQLICFDLADAKKTAYSFPQDESNPNNFYAFNLNGDLAFSITNSSETTIFNTKTKELSHNKKVGKIIALEKFNLQLVYLLKNENGYNIQKNDEEKIHLSIPSDYVFFGTQNTANLTCFIFRKNNEFSIYDINKGSLSHFTSPINSVEKVAVVSTSNSKNFIFFLDGVQNNIYLQEENQLTNKSDHIEGSHFVYSKTNSQLITYLDGNLICYEFTK